MNNEIEYWDCDEYAEMLYCESMNEAIESYLDSNITPLKGTLTVYGFVPSNPTKLKLEGDILGTVLEWLDEEYGPEDDYTEPTDTMAEAEDVFIDAILKEYVSRRYQVVHKEVVYVEDWVRENRPDWLPDLTA